MPLDKPRNNIEERYFGYFKSTGYPDAAAILTLAETLERVYVPQPCIPRCHTLEVIGDEWQSVNFENVPGYLQVENIGTMALKVRFNNDNRAILTLEAGSFHVFHRGELDVHSIQASCEGESVLQLIVGV